MFRYLKYIPILIFVSFFSLAGFAVGKEKKTADEPCNGFVVIEGSSNVNQFQFINTEPEVQNSAGNIQEENLIHIPVHSFETSNNRMLNDFYDMVKAGRHPYIKIEIEPRGRADFDEVTGMTNFRTKVTIAGKSNSYVVPSTMSECDQSGFMLKGDLQVKLTDFDIEPPTKLLGAVKVNDEVFIKFAFRMQHEGQLTEQMQE